MGNVVQLSRDRCAAWRNRAQVRRLYCAIVAQRDAIPRNTSLDVQMRTVLTEAIASLKAIRRMGVLTRCSRSWVRGVEQD